eukprot:UN15267
MFHFCLKVDEFWSFSALIIVFGSKSLGKSPMDF